MSRWLVVLTLMTGCGFGLSGPDPQRPREQLPKCDTGKGAVVVDGLMATVATIVALSLVAADEPAGALIPAGIGAAYIGGAVHGSRAVDECRAAMDDYASMIAAREQLDRQGPPGGIGDELEPTPPPRKKPPVNPVVVAPPPAEETVEEAPPVAPVAPTAPVKQPPAPTKQPPAAKQPPAKQPSPPSEDEWQDFWREVQ